MPETPFTLVRLAEVERIDNAGLRWIPIRRALGVTAFGINAYTGEHPGDLLIEPHDETSPGAGGHEEVYLVWAGSARFTIDGAEVDAPAGTLLRVAVGARRSAVAREANTTVLIVGGKPGAGLPVSPYEYWYAAQPAVAERDYERAIAIASEGLADWPEHGQLHYQLACYHALAGNRGDALRHLRVAFANEPRAREWAADDEDLVSVRNDPSLAP